MSFVTSDYFINPIKFLRIYHYDEDDFFIYVLIVDKIGSNYKFTSNHREAF